MSAARSACIDKCGLILRLGGQLDVGQQRALYEAAVAERAERQQAEARFEDLARQSSRAAPGGVKALLELLWRP